MGSWPLVHWPVHTCSGEKNPGQVLSSPTFRTNHNQGALCSWSRCTTLLSSTCQHWRISYMGIASCYALGDRQVLNSCTSIIVEEVEQVFHPSLDVPGVGRKSGSFRTTWARSMSSTRAHKHTEGALAQTEGSPKKTKPNGYKIPKALVSPICARDVYLWY